MSTVKERVGKAWRTTADTIDQLREGYAGASRFARLRIAIVGALAVNVVAVIVVLAVAGSRDEWVAVRFQAGFPGDMLIVHNLDADPMREVHVVLDDRFEATVEIIGGYQTVGIELAREFRDPDGAIPPSKYRPTEARVEWSGRVEVHPVPND